MLMYDFYKNKICVTFVQNSPFYIQISYSREDKPYQIRDKTDFSFLIRTTSVFLLIYHLFSHFHSKAPGKRCTV